MRQRNLGSQRKAQVPVACRLRCRDLAALFARARWGAPQGLERHAGLRLFATLVQNRFWLDVWLMLVMKIALSDDRGLLKQAAGRDVEGEADELGVCPFQRGGR